MKYAILRYSETYQTIRNDYFNSYLQDIILLLHTILLFVSVYK